MSSFKALPAEATLYELCVRRRDWKFYKKIGPAREYKPTRADAEIIRYFNEEYVRVSYSAATYDTNCHA
jgi:hypothetical protein